MSGKSGSTIKAVVLWRSLAALRAWARPLENGFDGNNFQLMLAYRAAIFFQWC
ncbi:hypothetical protein GJA_2232 [Janthinobacterium agaricidamnosum NBRC 102515 = DSM 9628]|uniref:Uncharacterized protein n=1 Tax=Janthinobacterium agaricidamnosum NBRC 102515 = DSM 9628 TaxID=1349767 RepID=W0V6G3_9BURK|nr:hypothetical protein GJA_2232 [Janthinobacterium agaricidamnosum NBRC 102515 = DSM 9628]